MNVVNKVRNCLTTMASNEETIWSFGYGSNMDVKALEAKKHVKVIGKYFKYLFVIFNFVNILDTWECGMQLN